MEEKKYMKWWQKLCYGAGDFGSNYALTFVTSFALIYMTDAVGLNAGVIGTLIMLSKLLDGVTDVLFGTLMDRTKSKMGKARPWMFWSTFPLAITEIMLFAMPQTSETLQYAYFFVVYTLLNAFFYTANNISYSCLTALVTKNPTERVQMGSIRFLFAAAAVLTINALTIGFVEKFGGGMEGWRTVALLYTGIMVLFNMITVFALKELPPEEDAIDHTQESAFADFWRNVKLMLQNKYCMLVLAYYILYYTSSAINNTVGVYYFSYVMGNAGLLGLFTLATMGPAMIGLVITPIVVKKLGIYTVNSKGMLISAIFAMLFCVSGYMGNFTLVLVFQVLRALFACPMMGTLNAVISEATHYTYLKEGVKLEGTMFAVSSMGMKVGLGVGAALCGWLLELGKYDGLAATQPESALAMMTFLFLACPFIISAVNAFVVSKLKVSQAIEELEAEKAA